MEEKIKEQFIAKFPALADKFVVRRARRIFIDVNSDNFEDVFAFVVHTLKANILCTITGLDEGSTFGIMYHMATIEGIMINIRTHTPRDNPEIKSISGQFPGADSYERELVDLLGIKVSGLQSGNRYPLPDNWPACQYPLRKDWKGIDGEILAEVKDA